MNATKTVAAYLAALAPDKRAALARLRTIIRSAMPRLEEAISYGMPGFRLDGKWVMWIGASANHCALYGVSDSAGALAGHDTSGRGTLRFRPDEPLPASLVRRLLRARVRGMKKTGTTAAKSVRQTARQRPAKQVKA